MEIDKTLVVQKREGRGKGPNGRLRGKDLVPGVFYTATGENVLVQAPALPLEKMYEQVGHTTVFHLEIDSPQGKETHPVLIWQVQRHPYKRQFLHIDYYGVDLNKEVKVEVPVEVVGNPKGVKLGGVLEVYREEIRLASKPLDMPQKIIIDVSDLDIGDVINVEDLKLPEHVQAVYDQNFAVVGVIAEEEETEEGGEEAAAPAAAAPAE